MKVNRQELATGAAFVAIGGLFILSTLLELPIGTPLRMGPGFFPLFLAGGLILVGLVVAARGLRPGQFVERPIPWRAIAVLIPVPIIFGLTIRGLGLVPSVFIAVFLSTFASRRGTVLLALILGVTITIFCAVVFHYGLRLPLPLFGTWLTPASTLP